MGDDIPPNMNGDYALVRVSILDFGRPKPNGMTLVYDKFMNDGPEAAMKQFFELIEEPRDYRMTETAINGFGYEMLRQENLNAAIEIFRANMALHPESAHVYDSLGEAYFTKGDKKQAKKYDQKALAINPNFESALEMMEKLK